MERYVRGDRDAFDELFRRYEPRVYGFFRKRTGSRERAEDLYQELFLRVHRARESYDPTRAFAPWLFRISHRLLVDDLRRAYRTHETTIGKRELVGGLPSQAEQAASRQRLARVLAMLSPEERHVLVAAKLQGVGYAQLAGQLGRSAEAVKKLASRAVQRLRADGVPSHATAPSR